MNRERHQNLRPADKKPNEKYGLVLGGGGSKGCYHVGVWQAFNEAGITFDALSGTSIGALVGIFIRETASRRLQTLS
ncbi:patatin-like phospholipase family protein [Allobaculum sp. Allo2]|uniref:patatin-like phospholipase family protein n=1 Tax=Allobaculum sp. Allo2 TaxID=2853432 RepID=UPI001F60E172|nr:patatin-like phospholipase family protein [Allobaculum sp. Allo2]UNT94385.1 patatin-like phospholipase family protein [Allobaculum sp. Allo2]